MRRLTAVVAVVALVTGACNSNYDRYRLRFEAPNLFAAPVGPVTFTVAPATGDVYYAELRTFDVYSVRRGELPQMLFHSHFKPDSIAVDNSGVVYVAARSQKHRLFISRFSPNAWAESLVWLGTHSHFAAHMAIAPNNELVLGWHTRLFNLHNRGPSTQEPKLISSGWTDPVFTLGRGNRLWVADNGLPGSKERVARGREKTVSKRNRFASVLPPYTNPSGMARVKDELILCSRTHKRVYRLHIGLDDVARRRNFVGRLMCDRDIAALPDGSLITAQTSAIYRYPPRR